MGRKKEVFIMNKKVKVKINLEFENESDLKEFTNDIKNIIPHFLEMPILHSDNVVSTSMVVCDHQVTTFLQASILMGEGFEKMLCGKKMLDSIESFRDEISRLIQIDPDEYLDKTVIQNVDGGHSIYNSELTEDEIRSIISNTVKTPQVFYINCDGNVNEIVISNKSTLNENIHC